MQTYMHQVTIRVNSARLQPVSYVLLLCRVSHYYSGGTTTV